MRQAPEVRLQFEPRLQGWVRKMPKPHPKPRRGGTSLRPQQQKDVVFRIAVGTSNDRHFLWRETASRITPAGVREVMETRVPRLAAWADNCSRASGAVRQWLIP